jgi:hypothetical protein
VRRKDVREASQLGVGDDPEREREEVGQIASRPPDHDRRHEQDEERSVRRPFEATDRDRGSGGDRETSESERRPTARQLTWWPPLAVAALLAILVRLPFFRAPLTADEGGYAEIARLWQGGRSLYVDLWVDRPQGLELLYRLALSVHLGSPVGLRLAAALAASLSVVVVGMVGTRLDGTLTGRRAAFLLATLGASPWIESFTLSAELLAALLASVSLLLYLLSCDGRRLPWLACAGLATGCAVMVKQSAFDAGLAAALALVLVERRKALGRVAILVGCAAVPVLAGAASAASPAAWWQQVVAYRGQGDSIVTGSPLLRAGQLLQSLPEAAIALGPLVVLALAARGRVPLLARLWVLTAALGVLGGGNFHFHYFVQLAPPLSVAAALALRSRGTRVARRTGALVVALSAALTLPLAFLSPSSQARWIWPRDPHLRIDGAVARFIRSHTVPGAEIGVVWAAADVYFLADRRPALRYLWFRNVQAVPGALATERRTLRCDPPALVAEVQPAEQADPTGATRRILSSSFRRVAVVGGVPLLAPRRPRAACDSAPPAGIRVSNASSASHGISAMFVR